MTLVEMFETAVGNARMMQGSRLLELVSVHVGWWMLMVWALSDGLAEGYYLRYRCGTVRRK